MSVVGTVIANVVANTEQFNKGLTESANKYSAFTKHIDSESKKFSSGSAFNKLDFAKQAAGATEFTSTIASLAGNLKAAGIAAGAGMGVATLVDMMVRGREATAGFSSEIFKLADAIIKTDNPFRRSKSKPFAVGTDEELAAASNSHLQQLRVLNSSKERNEILYGKRLGDQPMIDPGIVAELDRSNKAANEVIAKAREEMQSLIGDGSGKTIWDSQRKIWVKPAANDDPRVLDAERRIRDAQKVIRENSAAESRQEGLAQEQFKGRHQFGGIEGKIADGAVNRIGGFFNSVNEKFKELNKFSGRAQEDFAKKERREEIERETDPLKRFAKRMEDIKLDKSRLGLDDKTVGKLQKDATRDLWNDFNKNQPKSFASALEKGSSQAFNAILDAQLGSEKKQEFEKLVKKNQEVKEAVQKVGPDVAAALGQFIKVANLN
jgi:hypothetical protein